MPSLLPSLTQTKYLRRPGAVAQLSSLREGYKRGQLQILWLSCIDSSPLWLRNPSSTTTLSVQADHRSASTGNQSTKINSRSKADRRTTMAVPDRTTFESADAGQACYRNQRHRSISPMTMSMLPMMAGTSAIRQPLQISLATLRLQKQPDRARTRSGTASFPGRPTT